MKTSAMDRVANYLYYFWHWLMDVFAAEDGEERYEDDAWDSY